MGDMDGYDDVECARRLDFIAERRKRSRRRGRRRVAYDSLDMRREFERAGEHFAGRPDSGKSGGLWGDLHPGFRIVRDLDWCEGLAPGRLRFTAKIERPRSALGTPPDSR